jgi:3-hydroxyisobutyrate dehydrogenase-like beta-hydroxyacid dehydrogenase
MKLGFIGLGRMGSSMARNLLRAGHLVTVQNRSREKAEALAAEGIRIAASPADACRDVEAVLTMLTDDRAVDEVAFGESGVASALAPGAIHISCSTIGTAMARHLAGEHALRGQGYLSAPVFGRPEAAEAKKLIVVAAGAAALIERCRPVFDAIGRQTFVAGAEPWQANAVKLCGNFMIASMLETFGEAFTTMRKAGVDCHLFLDTMNALFGSPVYANYGRMMADERFEPAGFALKLGLKDVGLVLETAQECASPMPLASLIRDHLLSAVAQGEADLDWSSISRVIARNAGLP